MHLRRRPLREVGAGGGIRTRTDFSTRPSNVRVCQFHHSGTSAGTFYAHPIVCSRPGAVNGSTVTRARRSEIPVYPEPPFAGCGGVEAGEWVTRGTVTVARKRLDEAEVMPQRRMTS